MITGKKCFTLAVLPGRDPSQGPGACFSVLVSLTKDKYKWETNTSERQTWIGKMG